ncbi:MAG: Crp/Fnr family transcriptional regulator [Alphaproteobacteria bacterium]|nr:Crp/Fnr family transcriptional regulator [Alphaproteobacteria bacterium]
MSYSLPVSVDLCKELSALPLFLGVDQSLVHDLVASAHTVPYQKGATFVSIGDEVLHFTLVLEGWCAAGKGNPEGQEAFLQLFRRGDFLVELTPDGLAPLSSVNIQALTPVRLLSIAPSAIRSVGERAPSFLVNMLTATMRWCQDMRTHIEQLTLLNAEERVGRFLLHLWLTSGAEGRDVVLPFDKAAMASYLGIKPETLSRVFQTFRRHGFIIGRSHLTLPSSEALCSFCDRAARRSCPFVSAGGCEQKEKEVEK